MHWFERIALRRIDDAAANGQLRGLKGEGKPLDPVRLRESADDVLHLRERVAALSPAATLARGYAIAQDTSGHVLRDPAQVSPGQRLRLRLHGGDVAAVAAGTEEP